MSVFKLTCNWSFESLLLHGSLLVAKVSIFLTLALELHDQYLL
jgi:hypothetical protein